MDNQAVPPQPNTPPEQLTPTSQSPINQVQHPIIAPIQTIPLPLSPTPSKSKKKLFIILLIILLLIIMGSLGASYYYKHENRSITDQQTINDLNKLTQV